MDNALVREVTDPDDPAIGVVMVPYSRWTDARLVSATAAGRAEAFGVFFERHVDAVATYLRRRTSSAEDVADLVAETFAAALLAVHRGTATGVTDGAPWLVGIARNKLIDSYRRGEAEASAQRALKLERPSLTADAVERFDLSNAPDDLARAIANLSELERQALLERVVLEHEYEDIAASGGHAEPTVRKRVSRALLRVRSTMGAKA